MKHSASRELFEYWNRVRGSDRAPHRGSIEPSDIRRVLADTFILEVADREHYQVRLAGTRVCSIYCRELKGTNFFDLFQADDRSAMQTLGAAVTEDGAAAVVTVEAKTARGQEVAAELILLPLRHSHGSTFDRVLGSLAVLERPYWLGTEPVERQTIASLRLIWPDETPKYGRRRTDTPQKAAPRPVAVPGANAGIIQMPLPNSRRHGHLFVLDGGKE
ncbi:MAG TPA: PAS domain-containing protein [Bauldia sp.]|nr:PAS domain-containing protein [Bauldia sp.]